MYEPNISFKDYVNYKVSTGCFGTVSIKLDVNKVEEYHKKCITDISSQMQVDIELVKLIDSKIIVPINKLNDTLFLCRNKNIGDQIIFEDTEIRINKLYELCNNNSVIIQRLNNQFNKILIFSNSLFSKYTLAQLTKKKSNNCLSKKVEKIIYESYNDLLDIKPSQNDLAPLAFNINDINIMINSKSNISKELVLYCYNFIHYIYSLTSEEYNKIKKKVELRLDIEDKELNKRIEPIIKSKSNEISLNYDKIIKNIIESKEKEVNTLKQVIESLKDNASTASVELLSILEEKEILKNIIFELKEKTKFLEKQNKELEEKIQKLEDNNLDDKDCEFIEELIRRSSISVADLKLEL